MRALKRNTLALTTALAVSTAAPNLAYAEGYWGDQIQLRMNQFDAFPVIFGNVFSFGFFTDSNGPVVVSPHASIILSGAYLETSTLNSNGKITSTEEQGAWGVGGALGARIEIGGVISVKPEISALRLWGPEMSAFALEFGTDFGFAFGDRRPWSYTFDIARLGVRPSSDLDELLFFSFYPAIGMRYSIGKSRRY